MPSFPKDFVKRVQTLDGDKWKEHVINPMLYHFFSNSEDGTSTMGLPFAAEELRFSKGLVTGVAGDLVCKVSDKPKLDYFVIFGEDAFPISNFSEHQSNQKSLVLNVETTTQKTNLPKYIASKIEMFATFVDAHESRSDGSDCKKTVELFQQQLKGNTKNISYSSFDSIVDGTKVDFKLIIAGNWDKKSDDWNAISAHISTVSGSKRVQHVADISTGSWKVKTNTNCEFMIGQLDQQDVLDFAAMYDASKSKMAIIEPAEKKVRFEFVDRMLWMVTESAFDELNAHMSYNSLKEYTSLAANKTGIQHSAPSGAIGTISNISKIGTQTFDSGLVCDMYQIRLPLSTLARLGRVERTIASKAGEENLQRIPDGSHCKKMAEAIERKKRFHLPVFTFLPRGTDIHPTNQTIKFHGAHETIPFQWLIVDGQHRMLSHYYLRRDTLSPAEYTSITEDFEIDVCAYVPPVGADPAKIREAQTEIFYQINYLGKDPDQLLKIYHESHMLKRPSAFVWETGRRIKDRHKMLAMRFFSHLNKELNDANSTVFEDPVFDVLLTGQGMKISSLLTYLSPWFDFGTKFQKNTHGGWDVVSRKNKSLHPTLGWKRGRDTMIWGAPNCSPYLVKQCIQGPHPSECDAELKQLAKDFTKWLEYLDVKKKPDGHAATNWADGIFSWICLEGAKSHYLAALWRIFVHDYGVKGSIHHGNTEVDNWKTTKIGTTKFGISKTNQAAIGRAICRDSAWRPLTSASGQIKEIGKYIVTDTGGYNFDAAVIADGHTLSIAEFA